jgi:hypothetical protein
MAAGSLPTAATPSGEVANYSNSSAMWCPPLVGCYRRIVEEIEALFFDHHRGVIVSGPAGSGKSSRFVCGLLAARRLGNVTRHGAKARPPRQSSSVARLGDSVVGWHSLDAADRYKHEIAKTIVPNVLACLLWYIK